MSVAVFCDDCGNEGADNAFCDACLKHGNKSPASLVRDWLSAEKLKPSTDITPEVAALFERCAEDLEVA